MFQVFIFKEDEEEEIELPFTEEELAEKFEGKLEKEMKGPSYEVLSKLLKVGFFCISEFVLKISSITYKNHIKLI